MDLALSVGHARTCGRDIVPVGVVSLDGVARSGAVGLSDAYIVGCDPSEATPKAFLVRAYSLGYEESL